MGTKFASYSLKLASLHEYYQRILHGSQIIPSGVEIANTLKYFIQCLLSLLKDLESSPYEMLKSQELDAERMALYPNLDYKQLFNAVSQLIDVIPSIHIGLPTLGQTLLQCLTCLLPFLDHDLIDSLPYLTASSIATLPKELHQELINYLCFYILPFTIQRKTENEAESYASQSIAAVIMMVFEYSNESAYHCQLMETLMALKHGVVKDLLCVIAYGTTFAKASAIKVLYYYWPSFNSSIFDKKLILMKFNSEFTPFPCQRDDCPGAGSSEAAKVCYNHSVSIKFSPESPPPLYLCIECANEIHRDNPNQMFFDTLHPMHQDCSTCENKNCRAADKSIVSVCFSTECINYNGNHPIRYCQQCHNSRHNNQRGDDHIFHKVLDHIAKMDSQMQMYMVQAIISLFKESEPLFGNNDNENVNISSLKIDSGQTSGKNVGRFTSNAEPATLEDRQLLGRFGVWLLIGLCSLDEDIPVEILGRLLSMLFHWFHVTAYSHDGTKKSLIHLIFSVGQCESTMERLKTEYVCAWLLEVKQKYNCVFLACLLPHPSDYVRVGGHWEVLASGTSHLKEGLNRLFCMVPYDVITPEIWDYVMPHWMEAIVNDVPESDLNELKITLNKILDPEMSPLGFDPQKMYLFIANRFIDSDAELQEQALNWLQILTRLEIIIPLPLLFSMFSDGISAINQNTPVDITDELNSQTKKNESDSDNVKTLYPPTTLYVTTVVTTGSNKPTVNKKIISDEELNLSCCILMLDIVLRQMELQNITKHTGVNSGICKDICNLLKSTNIASWSTKHSCSDAVECSFCESTVMWYQLCLQLLTYVAPKTLAYPPDIISEQDEDLCQKSPSEGSKKNDIKQDSINMPNPELPSVGSVLVHMPHFFEQIMTATVETMSEQLDLATIVPSNKSLTGIQQTDFINANDGVQKSGSNEKQKSEEMDEEEILEFENYDENIWETSIGKFKFCISELPEQFQYIYKLFKELKEIHNMDILCYVLECLNKMCLYGDILGNAVKEHRGFFIWCQENLIIKNLWELLCAEYSHIAQVAVPLLLHCITLPSGQETFYNIIQKEFYDDDWTFRFTAGKISAHLNDYNMPLKFIFNVERVTLIARFMDRTPLKNAVNLQTSLANIFCYLITSMDDNNTYVAQKATLYLGTIHDLAIKALLSCMETQFDLVVIDRPIILQSLYQLHNSLCDRRILTWEFFFNRFDTLFIEAQIKLEKMGEINYFRDLKNSDIGKESFLQKVDRAHDALAHLDGSAANMKTLISSFGKKWPYKRTVSSYPCITIIDNKHDKEKTYSRQFSAPILKRKSSRFGLGQLIGYTLPNNSITDLNISPFNASDGENLSCLMNRIVEIEQKDSETIHLLIFLFHQFLSRPDQAYANDEKNLSKVQTLVLRHLYSLLGYNQAEKSFYVAPHKLRLSAVFGVFMTNFSQVLDQNHDLSLYLIEPLLIILQYSPCPSQKIIVNDDNPQTYSLWYLENYHRKSWLLSLLVILYKYEYKQQQWTGILLKLLKTVLFTLERQYHKCKLSPATVNMSAAQLRSKEITQKVLDLSDEPMIDEVQKENQYAEPVLLKVSSPNDQLAALNNSPMDTYDIPLTMNQDTYSIERNKRELEKDSILFEESSSEYLAFKPKNKLFKSEWMAPVVPENQVTIDLPKIERLLPVGPTGRTCDESIHKNQETYTSSGQTSSQSSSELEFPLPERLLPIGNRKEYSPKIIDQNNKLETTGLPSGRPEPIFKEKDVFSNKRFIKSDYPVCVNNTKSNELHEASRKNSRKLIKQLALESPSYIFDSSQEIFNTAMKKKESHRSEKNVDTKLATYFKSSKGTYSILDKSRCSECGIPIEEYTDEELGLCITILGALIHREPTIAAPMLPEILNTITYISSGITYSWHSDSGMHLPGGTISVAHQFLRCVLHQMAPNGIFTQIFQTKMKATWCKKYFKSVSQALIDFSELNPIAPLQILIENLNAKKYLQSDFLKIVLYNIASYLECLPLEAGLASGSTTWNALMTQFDSLFRRLILFLHLIDDMKPLYKIMVYVMKIPGIQISKGLLDPFSKIVSYSLQNSSLCYFALEELCALCNRCFAKDRDKYYLSRTVTFELMQALKFKTVLPDINLLLLVQFLLRDVGGCLWMAIDLKRSSSLSMLPANTNASESLKGQILDIIDFLMDVHTSSKIKSFRCGLRKTFNEDTLSGDVKCGLAQYLALEITKGNGRENRAINRFLPWLYSTVSTTSQSSRDFFDCVGRVRLLSWLILGSLNYYAAVMKKKYTQTHGVTIANAQPIPPEASCHIADHIQTIFSMFPEQYKMSTINLSSLFHSFNLCQLWTLYLENNMNQSNFNSESHYSTANILIEFWSKITQSLLQLLLHSKIVADIASLHFFNLLESLLDCGSMLFDKLLPIWSPILINTNLQFSEYICTRLKHRYTDVTVMGSVSSHINDKETKPFMFQWIRRLQFRMAQIEMQSSNAIQFYPL